MSATDGFSDLPYSDYPAVDSDDRYTYRNIQLDDIPYINNFNTLLSNLQNASSDSDITAAWNALEDFRATDEYKNHVYPCIDDALKWQRLEDCILACQRLAKRQSQQWVASETEPEDISQAVNDIWFKPTGETNSDGTLNYDMYQKTSSGYVKMTIKNDFTDNKVDTLISDIKEIKDVTSLPSDAASHTTTLYLITE